MFVFRTEGLEALVVISPFLLLTFEGIVNMFDFGDLGGVIKRDRGSWLTL